MLTRVVCILCLLTVCFSEYTLVQSLVNVASSSLDSVAVTKDQKILILKMSQTGLMEYNLVGSIYRIKQIYMNFTTTYRMSLSDNGSVILIRYNVYQLGETGQYSFINYLAGNADDTADVTGSGLAAVSFSGFYIQVFRRSELLNTLNVYRNITNPKVVWSVAQDGNTSMLAALSANLIYVYSEVAGSYKAADMFPTAFQVTQNSKIRALLDFSALFVYDTNSSNLAIHRKDSDGYFYLNQTMNFSSNIIALIVDNRSVAVHLSNNVTIMEERNGIYVSVQNLAVNYSAIDFKNGTLVGSINSSAYIWKKVQANQEMELVAEE